MFFDEYTLLWIFYILIIQLFPRYLVLSLLKSREKKKIITTKEGLNNISLEISSWDFCVRLFLICLISFKMLFLITDKYSDYIIVQSGILIPFWLFITGSLVRILYYIFGNTRHWKNYKILTEEQKQVFWVAVPIMLSIVYSYNKNISLMIIAILIGKFMWLDFTINRDSIHNVIQFVNKNKRIISISCNFGIFILFGSEIINSIITQ